MIYMLCRNRVASFAKWKRGLDSHTREHRAAGMKLVKMWRDRSDVNNVFFLFEIKSMKMALAFIQSPQSAEAGTKFGVLDGEYHFITEVMTKGRIRSGKKKAKVGAG